MRGHRIALIAGFLLALLAPALAGAQKAGDPGRYNERRAFPGAPPVYTHSLEGDVDLELDTCLSCHKKGSGGAPVTPHPSLPECRQCHVMAKSAAEFRPTGWTPPPPPPRVPAALPGAPPPIPHPLTPLASNCLACHRQGGTGRAIPTAHPERKDCQQCHVQVQARRPWSREP